MSAASSSSSHTGQAVRILPPDSTYKSLASLLSSTAATASSHIDLIPANGLSSSITHYLSTLPTEDAAQFAKTIAKSNALWSSASSLLPRANLVFEATARSVLTRINVIVAERKGSLGWSARRALVSWLRAIADSIHLDVASLPASCSDVPLTTLALHTGLLGGLQAAKAQRVQHEKRGLSVQYALDRAEDEWCIALAECLDALAGQDAPQDEWEAEFRTSSLAAQAANTSHGESVKISTLFLAAQVSPYVATKKLTALPTESLTQVLSETMLGMFQDSKVLDFIREDLTQDTEGRIVLRGDSPTSVQVTSLISHPLYPVLGPLSRMLSLALSNAIRTSSPLQVQELFSGQNSLMSRMQTLAHQWQSRWLSCRLAGAVEADIDPPSQAQTTNLWGIFKALLFSYTMIFDALMEAIVDVCPSPTVTLDPDTSSAEAVNSRWPPSKRSNIPSSYLQMTQIILIVYSHLSWITATFGSAAFDAYRRVFYEALEVLARDHQASVDLVEQISPHGSQKFLQVNAGRRAAITYYMDVVEQSMGGLPDEMVEQEILPLVEDYLEHADFQSSYESAHSVVLSIFATQKAVVCELAPYYIDLILQSFPAHLTEDQLLHAYSTVINAASDKSDTVTWYLLEKLWTAIEAERLRIFSPTNSDSAIDPARRRSLANAYVAQLPNINLVLLRSTLLKVKLLVLQEQAESEERTAICEKVFERLAGLDASTREEGLRWWLEERKTFGV